MLSDKVLLCAPYRFQSDFLYKNDRVIKNELFSVLLSGLNMQTRALLKYGLENNYDIVDKNTLEHIVSELEEGNYRIVEDVEQAIASLTDQALKSLLMELYALTDGKGIQGFDDCRIIDTLTKAYAAKFLPDTEFNQLFERHTNRIIKDYSSWEQYLASCVLGKLCQHDILSLTVTTKEEFIEDIYNYCLIPVNVFSFATFWNNFDLQKLGCLLSQILESNYDEDKENIKNIRNERSGFAHVDNLSADFISKWENDLMLLEDIDLNRYDYLTNLVKFVFWNPLVENELDWMFTSQKGEQTAVLMPKEYAGLASASQFWIDYNKFSDLQNSNIMVMLCKIGIAALFTEKEIYHFEKKLLFKKIVVATPWEQAVIKVDFDFDFGVTLKLNGKKILDMLDVPDYTLIGLTKADIKAMTDKKRQQLEKEWAEKLQKVLYNIPNKIKEFQSK